MIKPEDIQIKIKKETQTPLKEKIIKPEEKVIKPEDIQIKIKNETQSNDTIDKPSSMVDKMVKEMDERKKVEELEKEIKKEKQEEAKASAKKEAILKLLKPEKQ